MQCYHCKNEILNNSLAKIKTYYSRKNLNFHRQCIQNYVQENFKVTLINYLHYINIKSSSFEELEKEIINVVENLRVLLVFDDKIEVKRGFLNLLSLTVLKKFLEPKYLTINNTFYQIKDEYYNKQFYESIKSLQKQIIDILEKKINCI